MKTSLLARSIKTRASASAKRNMAVWRPVLRIVLAAVILAGGALQASTPPPGNMVPNPSFRGDQGLVAAYGGTITGTVPTLWRAFAVNGAGLSLERLDLAADVLFPGSPPTQAVKITVSTFGADQGLDHDTAKFSFRQGNSYRARIYARSGNADNSAQSFNLGMPIYDSAQDFTGRDPASLNADAGAAWAAFDSSVVAGQAGDAFAHLSIRVHDDGGENSLIVALPSVLGPAVFNIAPNPGFSGASGESYGTVNGSVPDEWRAMSLGAGTLDVTTVPLAAGALFPGSLPTYAVRLEITGGDELQKVFDHEGVRAILSSDYLHWGEFYARSGNSDLSNQSMIVGMPVYDAAGTYTDQAPGTFSTTVGPEWSYVAGPPFTANAGETTNIAIHVAADGGQDVLLIASPRIVGPIGPVIFMNGFEGD